jgi:uncharacterized NAD(P)/FAD-binding protein YdhS
MRHLHNSANDHDLLIIGNGFAASAALAWMARFAPSGLRIGILAGACDNTKRQTSQLGSGLGYSDQDPIHLLNAAHWNMGLLDDDPDSFTRWLEKTYLERVIPDFAPRAVYGEFLCAQWHGNLGALSDRGIGTKIIDRLGFAIETISRDSVTVIDDAGLMHTSSALLVCEGPICVVQGGLSHDRLISPIWPNGLARMAGASGHVAIMGIGLSGIDAAISALGNRDVSKVTMISRHGQLPLSHDIAARDKLELDFLGGPIDVLGAIRAACANAPWQAVMNALRSQSNDIWRRWSPDQRKAALRHLGAMWAMHRNRLPPTVSAQLFDAREKGRLELVKGCASVQISPNGALGVRLKNQDHNLNPDWVIDARGFARVTRQTDSICGRALRDGLLGTSESGHGVAASISHCATPDYLAAVHVVGAARVGDLIETTGAPEVRAQVRQSLEALLK